MNAIGLISLGGMLLTGAALVAMRVEARRGAVHAPLVHWLKVPLNAAGFAVRRRLRFSRGPYTLVNEEKTSLFAYLPAHEALQAEAREVELRSRYSLEACAAESTQDDYREVLYHLDVLDTLDAVPQLVPLDGAARLRVLDVGSKDFRYALALERWISRKNACAVSLRGVEVDVNGLYRNLHSRRERAEAYCRAVGPHVAYDVDDFLTYDTPPVDVLTVFFPFVLAFTLVAWGLPLRHFKPEQFFARYKQLIRRGGLLLIANQTSEEKVAAFALMEKLGGFRLVTSRPMRSRLVSYLAEVDDRHVHVWRREA